MTTITIAADWTEETFEADALGTAWNGFAVPVVNRAQLWDMAAKELLMDGQCIIDAKGDLQIHDEDPYVEATVIFADDAGRFTLDLGWCFHIAAEFSWTL